MLKQHHDTKIPLVSVCMITYNHEKYIETAIKSIIKQITTFQIELIISDDCSQDNTINIIEKYQTLYADIISVIAYKENIGAYLNGINCLSAARGNYIALCEGDDYWTDPFKLQKQIDFLEVNPDFTISCHQSSNYNEDEQKIVSVFPKNDQDMFLSLSDLIHFNIANTCTIVYRNIEIKIPDFFSRLALGDWPLHMIYANHGKIHYLKENMAHYRVHNRGSWSSTSYIKNLDNTITMLKYMNEYFEYKYHVEFSRTLSGFYYEKAKIFLKQKNLTLSVENYNNCLSYGGKIKTSKKIKYFIRRIFLEFIQTFKRDVK
jgi:glycosyltransferase involved in cell wall biosynthesis